MVGMWSSLLASAAKTSMVEPRLVGVLKELGSAQAVLLSKMAKSCWVDFKNPCNRLQNTPLDLDPRWVQRAIGGIFQNVHEPAKEENLKALYSNIIKILRRPGRGAH
jgi:hypothetical protein